ncbi:MAG: hypothetical protein H5T86_00105 [Armatimonadetes bacterium]|nr:hypothetical protein [Armatimonadota bacterium]
MRRLAAGECKALAFELAMRSGSETTPFELVGVQITEVTTAKGARCWAAKKGEGQQDGADCEHGQEDRV